MIKISNIKHRVNSWVVIAAVIAAVVLVNIIVSSLQNKLPLKIDITESKQYEITSQTKEVIKTLEKDASVTEIKLQILASRDTIESNIPEIAEYIERYRNLSSKIKVEYVDVYTNQTLLNEYKAKGETLTVGDMIVSIGERYKVITLSNIYSETFDLSETTNYTFNLEAKLTNAVVTVSGLMQEAKVYFLEGHGEQTLQTLPGILDMQDYSTDIISITNTDIPDDAQLVICAAPTADFTAEECERIDKFLENGGNFLAVFYPTTQTEERLPKLKSYMQEWGITVNNDVVLELDESSIYQSPLYIYPKFADNDIVKTISEQKLAMLVPQPVSIELADKNPQGASVSQLLTTTDKGLSKANKEQLSAEVEEGDKNGTFTLAAVSERESTNSRVMVLGSVHMLETGLEGNSMFMQNAVTWLTDNTNDFKISPKVISVGRITGLTQTMFNVFYILFVFVIPIIILAAGLVIWNRRRFL